MSDALRCQYVLGPCDARTADIPVAELRGGSVSCGGAVYYVRPNTANPVVLDFAALVESRDQQNLGYDPRAVFATFHALMGTLAYTVPQLMTETRGAIARMRKAVR